MVLFLAASLALLVAPGVFTVDDDGPADFVGIVEALASPLVADGDTLLVASGSYGDFQLTKALHVLPMAGQSFSAGKVSIDRLPFFTLVGATLRSLDVADVPGRSLIDRCTVTAVEWTSAGGFYHVSESSFLRCGQLVVQRSSFRGADACYTETSAAPGPGASVEDSTIIFTESRLTGGDGAGLLCDEHYPWAGAGLTVRHGSVVQLAGTTVVGGTGPWTGSEPAIKVLRSTVVVRGNADDYLHATGPAKAIWTDALSSVTVSGVVLSPPTLQSYVVVPSPAEPFLRLAGGEAPGKQLELSLFGPQGAAALLAFSNTPQLAPLGAAGDLWLDPGALLASQPVVLRGQRQAVSLHLPLPSSPTLIGTPLVFQAWVAATPGAGPWLTNPCELVLGG